jgi:hypothetical protein
MCLSALVESPVLSPEELAQIGYVSKNQDMPGSLTSCVISEAGQFSPGK